MVKKKGIKIALTLIALVIVSIILIIGFTGISKEICYQELDCKRCYKEYIIIPYIYDTIQSIFSPRPGGSTIGIVREHQKPYTHLKIIKCLCDKEEEEDVNIAIINFFNNVVKNNTIGYFSFPHFSSMKERENPETFEICKIHTFFGG